MKHYINSDNDPGLVLYLKISEPENNFTIANNRTNEPTEVVVCQELGQ